MNTLPVVCFHGAGTSIVLFFFFQAEDGIRDDLVTGVQTCAIPILGVVETARAFIEQNSARLTKAMKPTGAQPYESGDIVALSFADPDGEAGHIAETIQSLRGVAFKDDEVERGLSWSDMAVLLRSVKANAEPITRALQAAGIPFVVTGMTNLFGTAEAEAARQLFYFIADRPGVDAPALKTAWAAARLGINPAALDQAIAGA